MSANEVGPNDEAEYAPPEAQLQVADGEKPSGKPEGAEGRVLSDSDAVCHLETSISET